MLLAGAGLDVTVYERHAAVGGRTRVVRDNGGFRFDVGATFFLYPDVLRRVFGRCGLALEDYVDLRRVDPQYRLVFADGPEVRATYDIDQLEREIAKLDPVDARELRRFLERGRRKLAAFKPVLERPFSKLTDFASLPVLKALRWLKPFTSVNDDLATHFRDPRVRLAFSFQTKYLGMSPFRCPSLFTILALLEYEFGVWHPMGGCGAVSEAMARAARDIGVTFKLGQPVTSIAFEGSRAVGVTSAAGFQPADAVVVNADFAGTIGQLVPDHLRRHWPDKRIDKAKYSCSTFMLYLGVDGRYDHLDHHTIFLSKDYAGNIAEIEAGLIPADPSIYLQNPSATDPAFGDAGSSSLYVLVPVGNLATGTVWDADVADAFKQRVLARLEALGLTDLRRRIRSCTMTTPRDWADGGLRYGATFNLSHGLDQMLLFRPRNRFSELERLYLVGGGTHPGSGLPVIYEGARISTDLALADLGITGASGLDTHGMGGSLMREMDPDGIMDGSGGRTAERTAEQEGVA